MSKGKRRKKSSRTTTEGKILLIDDERDLVDLFPSELKRQGGFEVCGFTDPAVAL
jgi:hypothetical protein